MKQTIEQKLDTICEVLEKIDDRLTNLEGGWTKMEIQNARIKQWPQIGDTFFRLNSKGQIYEQVWTGSSTQSKIESFMGVYKTREEAEWIKSGIMTFVAEERY